MSISLMRTTCTFCPFGCTLEIVRRGRQILGVEYPEDSPVNAGRVCARGTLAARLLDHPRRLCYPLLNGKERTWDEFFAEVGPQIRNCPSDELAVTYDRNLTIEEQEMVAGFAHQFGTDNLAAAWPEAELLLDVLLRPVSGSGPQRSATLDDIVNADSILLVGDVFGAMPVVARTVLDARYRERNRKLYCLDSIRTNAAGFAHKFLWVKPGTEPIVLFAIASLLDARMKKIAPETVVAASGVTYAYLNELAADFARNRKGVIIAALNSGRTSHPELLTSALRLLMSKLKGTKGLLASRESAVVPGPSALGHILNRIEQGKIRILINFGMEFPFAWPALLPRLEPLQLLVTTAVLRPRMNLSGWVLPVPLDIEKSGTVRTLWGEMKLVPAARPVSGSRTIEQLISGLIGSPPARVELPLPPTSESKGRELAEQVRQLFPNENDSADDEYRFQLLAERPAYGFVVEHAPRNLSPEAPTVSIHPADARSLGIRAQDNVRLATPLGSQRFAAHLSETVRPGTLLVDYNRIVTRNLFPFRIDNSSGMVIVSPTRAKIWRDE